MAVKKKKKKNVEFLRWIMIKRRTLLLVFFFFQRNYSFAFSSDFPSTLFRNAPLFGHSFVLSAILLMFPILLINSIESFTRITAIFSKNKTLRPIELTRS